MRTATFTSALVHLVAKFSGIMGWGNEGGRDRKVDHEVNPGHWPTGDTLFSSSLNFPEFFEAILANLSLKQNAKI